MEIATLSAVNWIYDFSDYQQMYDLTERDCTKSIFDFSSGLASFNAEATQRGMSVVSMDALYALSDDAIRTRAQQFLQEMVVQLQVMPDYLQNSSREAIDRVIQLWQKTEELFLADYVIGKSQCRYQPMQQLPLSYETHQFELAFCTDFIFHHALSRENINAVLMELCRVAEEVRLYPLLDHDRKMPKELGPLMLALQQKNFGVEVREVSYRTLKGGNAMLRIWQQECHI